MNSPAFLSPASIKASSFSGRPAISAAHPLPLHAVARQHGRVVTAVAAKPKEADKPIKLSKVEGLKTASNQLRFPLTEELKNEEIFITENAVQIMKFHGSYQQDDREKRAPGQQKAYQFMLRLKMPSGEFPAELYKVIDDISENHGNLTLRATTRCAWQIHGILKSDLKTVFSSIMNAGGSCTGACGDLSRNVMTTPAPFTSELYRHARYVSKMVGELFAPQSGAFSEIWLDGEKAATIEYWKNDLDMKYVQEVMRFDNGNGVVFKGGEEPIYGETYLPRKFKVGVTVPGDNSIDIYTQDIGIVCIPDASGKVIGYNIIVGGGMGRTHRKESTFARAGDHLGYVQEDRLWEALKAIVATQRDHGNRSVRANARMKYLVDKLGIDGFRVLAETYFGAKFEPFRDLPAWKYEDWLGWHEQGDGTLFLGLFIEHGRVKDDGDMRLRSALRRITDAYEFDMVVTPNQNVILKNISANQKVGIEAILKEHNVKLADEYNINRRISMACPALPLCGLATTEAERVMPTIVDRMNVLFSEMDIGVPITMRMTGCPNGCARPYMAELGFVGAGKETYQLWLGGCPNQTRLAWPFYEKADEDKLEEVLTPVLDMFVKQRYDTQEAFGDFCHRIGKDGLLAYMDSYNAGNKGIRVTIVDPEKEKPRVTVVEHDEKPRVTVVEGGAGRSTSTPKVKKVAVVAEEDVRASADADVGGNENGVKASKRIASRTASTAVVAQSQKRKRTTTVNKPRLTVSDELMERLKNIAALRDMSASMVADEIISAFLSGVDDEDALSDLEEGEGEE